MGTLMGKEETFFFLSLLHKLSYKIFTGWELNIQTSVCMHLETGLPQNSALGTRLKKLRFLDERGHDGVDDKSRDDDDDDDDMMIIIIYFSTQLTYAGLGL